MAKRIIAVVTGRLLGGLYYFFYLQLISVNVIPVILPIPIITYDNIVI